MLPADWHRAGLLRLRLSRAGPHARLPVYGAWCRFFPCPPDFIQQVPVIAEPLSLHHRRFATSMLFLPYHHSLPECKKKSFTLPSAQNGCQWLWDCQTVFLERLATDNPVRRTNIWYLQRSFLITSVYVHHQICVCTFSLDHALVEVWGAQPHSRMNRIPPMIWFLA